jgi:hypothetical protein
VKRRLGAAALIAMALALAACSSVERPEGIVERWLVSLNQGAAGRPDTYATPEVSEIVLPGWRDREPGAMDLIRVGRGVPGEGGSVQVPFRIVREDGTSERFLASLVGGRVVALPRTTVGPIAPSIGHAPLAAWLAAIGIALVLALLTAALMRLVPEPAGQAGSSR